MIKKIAPDIEHAESRRRALLLVDLQYDFLPGGKLAIENGDAIIDPIGRLLRSEQFSVVVATQDWHPPEHISFASHHPRLEPFQRIDLYGHEQTLWPPHCVQGTRGANLADGIPWERVAAILRKGADPDVDSYSGFRDNWNQSGQRPSTGLAGYLRDRGVTDVLLCGLARDVCVKWSAEDAAEAGFRVVFLWELTRPVDPASNDRVRDELIGRGVEVSDFVPVD